MSCQCFPYVKIEDIYAPVIPVQMKGTDGWHRSWAYVDSGATFSVFKASEAERLGFDLSSGGLIYLTVGDGGAIPVYIHHLTVRIGEEELYANIGFSEKLGVAFNLLGRADVFEKFKICFRDAKRMISFEREDV